MKSRYLFVGGPMDGLMMFFETPIPYRVKVSDEGKMIKVADYDECEWPFYSQIPISNDTNLSSATVATGKYIYIEKCSFLDRAMKAM